MSYVTDFFGGKRKRSAQSRAVFLRRNGSIIMVYAFILLLFIIGITQSERFFTERNLVNVARQSAFLGIVALGQMLVILTAGIDLSVGSLVKVSILVSAIVMNGESANVLPPPSSRPWRSVCWLASYTAFSSTNCASPLSL